MIQPKKKYSLRGHLYPIAWTRPVIINSVHHLLSADSNGWVIVWGLSTNRPIAIWQAHKQSIVTVKQIGDRILTHGKDSLVRLWTVQSINNLNSRIEDVPNADKFPQPDYIEIPVNTLNFCNVDYFNNHLITPSTIDSENFDVYTVFDSEFNFLLNRVLTNISTYNVLCKQQGIDGEINSGEEGRGKFGIIMRLLIVSEKLFYVGYELGHVFAFETNFSNQKSITHESKNSKTIINALPSLTIVYEDSSHCPNPVLSLEYNASNSTVLSGSASKKLLIHHIPAKSPPESCNTHHYGIQSISVDTNDLFALHFWDGIVKGYSYDLQEKFKLQRPIERITKIDSNEEPTKPSNKVTSVNIFTASRMSSGATSYRELVKSKRSRSGRMLFIGYTDGLIDVYDIAC